MLRQVALTAVLVGLGAVLISLISSQRQPPPEYRVRGKNNTILFLTNEHAGLCNVHLATAYALLENHPEIQVHYASFRKTERRVRQISSLLASKKTGPDIEFHPLPNPTYTEALLANGDESSLIHPPGLAGIDQMARSLPEYISPWAVEDYYTMYKAIGDIIDQVDPAVIALDTMLSPAVDATREKRRVHAILTPNILADMMPAVQPKYTLFWKYPALASGFPYPVPWALIPANIYINFRVIASFLSAPKVNEKKKFLKEKGLENPVDFLGIYHPEVPWITQTLPGAHVPVIRIPRNVTLAGPINLAGTETNVESGADLLAWIERRPTVLIALGSTFRYSQHDAVAMTEAVQQVLQKTDVQVLWKMDRLQEYNTDFLSAAVEEAAGRLRVEKWLEVEPPTLLQSGHIAAFVHHGGAGCYHDALSGGVPQVILPQWADLYNLAQLVEDLGIGVWGCRDTSPGWSVDGLRTSMLKVLDGRPSSTAMREKAVEFGNSARKNLGRNIAADELARLAGSGR